MAGFVGLLYAECAVGLRDDVAEGCGVTGIATAFAADTAQPAAFNPPSSRPQASAAMNSPCPISASFSAQACAPQAIVATDSGEATKCSPM